LSRLAQFKDLHLSEDEAKALIVVREAGALNNGTYRELTKVDTLTASQSLRRLPDAGLLAQKGRGSATYYVPTESLVDKGLSSTPPGKFDEVLRRQLLDGISGTLAAIVGALGQRHPPQAVRDVVAALCQVRDWRADELSTVLRRNPEVVRQNYLRPLMREGRLTMTNPQEPNDPQQAYRAV
jgi:ATP-dependent DNA helicase RecG